MVPFLRAGIVDILKEGDTMWHKDDALMDGGGKSEKKWMQGCSFGNTKKFLKERNFKRNGIRTIRNWGKGK